MSSAAAPKERKPSKKEKAADAEARMAMKACASEVEAQCAIIVRAYKVLKEKMPMHGEVFKQRFMQGVSPSGEGAFMSGTVGIKDVEMIGSNAGELRKFLEENEDDGE